MRKLTSAVTICCLAFGLSTASSLAQQGNAQMNEQQNGTHQSNQVPSATSQNMAQSSTKEHQSFRAELARSEKVLGATVYDTNGRQIGEINDIVFDENTGGETRAILSINEYLGTDGQLTPVEWNKINARRTDDHNYRFTVTATKAALQKEQSFSQDNWPNFSKGWNQENVQGTKLVRMSQVDDASLYDSNGEQIGGMKDVMLDTQSGRVAYAVVSFSSDFINQGDKLTMVPWNLVRQSKKTTPGYVLHANKSQLEDAAYFSPNEWPNVNNVSWNKSLYQHYGVTPYWTRG